MPVDERSRHELHRRLEENLGPDAAATLMAHLPPRGWADVATKADLAALEDRIALRFDVITERFAVVDEHFAVVDEQFAMVEERFGRTNERIERAKDEVVAAFRGELVSAVAGQTRTMVLALMGSMLTTGSLVLAATKLG